MFEDIDPDGFEVRRDSPDRVILCAIFLRGESGDLPVDEAWGILADRYPEEVRFLLLNAFEEFMTPGMPGELSADRVVRKSARLATAGKGEWKEAVGDVLSLAREHLGPLTGADRDAFERLAAGFGGARRDTREATRRLEEMERRVLEECHDRTLGGRPLAKARPIGAATTQDLPGLLAATRESPEKIWSVSVVLHKGDRVRHPTFGVGMVVAVRERKADILFPGGRKVLACG
jgi:hypothetical protein